MRESSGYQRGAPTPARLAVATATAPGHRYDSVGPTRRRTLRGIRFVTSRRRPVSSARERAAIGRVHRLTAAYSQLTDNECFIRSSRRWSEHRRVRHQSCSYAWVTKNSNRKGGSRVKTSPQPDSTPRPESLRAPSRAVAAATLASDQHPRGARLPMATGSRACACPRTGPTSTTQARVVGWSGVVMKAWPIDTGVSTSPPGFRTPSQETWRSILNLNPAGCVLAAMAAQRARPGRILFAISDDVEPHGGEFRPRRRR